MRSYCVIEFSLGSVSTICIEKPYENITVILPSLPFIKCFGAIIL